MTNTISEQKLQMLNSIAASKRQTLLQCEVNMSIYATTIQEIDSTHAEDPELQSFKANLNDMIVEQQRMISKESVLLTAIESQISQLTAESGN